MTKPKEAVNKEGGAAAGEKIFDWTEGKMKQEYLQNPLV